MKKEKREKLALGKSTVANLGTKKLKEVKGGFPSFIQTNCYTVCPKVLCNHD